jgi:hypothetical protein
MSSTCTVMYWLAVPALFGLKAPWAPCAPSPIMPSPNSTIVWSIAPSAHAPRGRDLTEPERALRNEGGTDVLIRKPRNNRWSSARLTSCLIAAMSVSFPRSSAAGSNAAAPQLLARSTRLHRDLPCISLRLE